MPHHHMVIPHYMGRSKEIDVENKKTEENPNKINRQNSFSSLSPLEDNIPLLLPQESDTLVDTHSEPTSNGLHASHNLMNEPVGVCRDSSLSSQKQEVEALVPETKGSADELDMTDFQSDTNLSVEARSDTTDSDEWWENLEERNQINASADDDCGQVGPRISCRCQVSDSPRNGWKKYEAYDSVIFRAFFNVNLLCADC